MFSAIAPTPSLSYRETEYGFLIGKSRRPETHLPAVGGALAGGEESAVRQGRFAAGVATGSGRSRVGCDLERRRRLNRGSASSELPRRVDSEHTRGQFSRAKGREPPAPFPSLDPGRHLHSPMTPFAAFGDLVDDLTRTAWDASRSMRP